MKKFFVGLMLLCGAAALHADEVNYFFHQANTGTTGWWRIDDCRPAVYATSMDGQTENAPWPGVAMTYLERDDNNDLWYLSIDTTIYKKITFVRVFSTGEEAADPISSKSREYDITSLAGNNYFTLTSETQVETVEGEWYNYGGGSLPGQPTYYLLGDAGVLGAWSLESALPMEGDSIELTLDPGTYNFKVLTGQSWDNPSFGYSYVNANCTDVTVQEGSDGNIQITAGTGCHIIVKNVGSGISGVICITGTQGTPDGGNIVSDPIDATIDGLRYTLSGGSPWTAEVAQQDLETFSLSSVNIPSTVTYNEQTYTVTGIATNAFYNISTITRVTLPSSVTSIGEAAFDYCTQLERINIPDGITKIANYTFRNCEQLDSITIPSSVDSIGDEAFGSCTGMHTIYCMHTTPPYLHVYAFSGIQALNEVYIYVPSVALSAYRADEAWQFPSPVMAICPNSGSCGADGATVNWTLDCDSVLTIDGTGAMADYEFDGTPWYRLRASIKQAVVTSGVTRIGAFAFYNLPNLRSVDIQGDITGVGAYAFSLCTSLHQVNLPQTMTRIEDNGFEGSGLTSIVLPSSMTSVESYVFSGCVDLKYIEIPAGISSFAAGAFEHCMFDTIRCYATTPPEMEESFESDGTNAVVLIPFGTRAAYQQNEYWGEFSNFVEMPCNGSMASGECGADGGNLTWVLSCDSVLTISGSGAMANYNGSSSVPWSSYQSVIRRAVIGAGVTSLSVYSTFEECSALESVIIPEGITSLGDYTFNNCTSLKGIDLPSTITSLGSYCFSGCSGMDSITCRAATPPLANGSTFGIVDTTPIYVPAGTTETYRSADGWSGLTDYRELPCTMPIASGACGAEGDNLTWELGCDSLMTISGTGAMTESDGDQWYANRQAIKRLDIGQGVTNVGSYAFREATNMREVVIGEGVTKIGNSAFWGCSGMRTVVIPSTVDTIEDQGFRSCAYLESIVLPAAVKYIGTWAFAYCYIEIDSIVCHATTPPTCGNEAFYEINTSTPLYVPAQSVAAYKAADVWKNFTNILALPECVVASGECGAEGDNVRWSLSSDGVMTISGTGAMATYSTNQSNQAPWAEDGLKIRDIVIEEGVTSIGSYAFYNAGSYTNGAYNNVRSVSIPSTVAKLVNNYFYQCPIETVTINSDSIVGKTSYSSSSTLQNIFGAQVRQYIIGDSVKAIASSAFRNQSADSLRRVILPEGITSIGTWAFGYLENMDSITLPSTLQSIDADAFYGSGLKAVTIPAGVTSMGGQAFQNCNNLTSLTLENGLTMIGTSAFANCTALPEITIPESMQTISSGAFTGCTNLTKVTVLSPSWVGENKSSSQTTKQALGGYVRELILGDNITTIGKYAFSSLDSLRKILLPSTVTVISDYAFSSCSNLASVTCEAYTPPTIQANSFSIQDTLFVRCETRATYKAADYWKNFNKLKCFDGGDEYDEMEIGLNQSWTFIMLPSTFSMSAEDIVTSGEVQWGTYNGSTRAMGYSGWENYAAASVYMCSQALIVRATGDTATLRFNVPLAAQNMSSTTISLIKRPSNHPENANWCFLGNPYPYGYLLSGLAAQGITSPVTIWNGTGYDTYTPGIDDIILEPFQAFFIQLPDGDDAPETITFSAEYIMM